MFMSPPPGRAEGLEEYRGLDTQSAGRRKAPRLGRGWISRMTPATGGRRTEVRTGDSAAVSETAFGCRAAGSQSVHPAL
jgi:hypothetical protein